MTPKPEDWAIAIWKQQIGTAFRLMETITDQSRKLRECQLAAAVEAHASAVATRESLANVSDATALWRLQNEWLSQSLQDCAAYWRRVCECAAETQTSLANCACEPLAQIVSPATQRAAPSPQRKAA